MCVCVGGGGGGGRGGGGVRLAKFQFCFILNASKILASKTPLPLPTSCKVIDNSYGFFQEMLNMIND